MQVGDIVIYMQHPGDVPFNGFTEHPAIVTHVWSDDCVNLTVFPDQSSHVLRVSSCMRAAEEGVTSHNGNWRERA